MTTRSGSKNTKKTISAVIVHLGKLELIEGCLDTLYESTCIDDVECIVVDNASDTKGLEELILKYKNVTLIRLSARVGYSCASNFGIQASSGKYILWCNNDLLFDKESVAMMSRFLDANSDVGAVGPKLLNPNGTYQPSFSSLNMGLKPLLVEQFCIGKFLPKWDLIGHTNGVENKNQNVAVVTGACCMLRREALESIGGMLDERFYMYSEEFDLCHSMAKAGWNIFYLSQASVTHLGGQSTKQAKYLFLLQARRSHFAYLLKHYGVYAELIFAAGLMFGTGCRTLVIFMKYIYAKFTNNHGEALRYIKQLSYYRALFNLCLSNKRHFAEALPRNIFD